MFGLVKPLKEENKSPLALATALLVAWGVWQLSRVIVGGLLGSLLSHLNLANAAGTWRLALGSVVQEVLVVAIALFAMLSLLKGGSAVGEFKSALSSGKKEGAEEGKKEEEKKEDEKKD